MGSEEEGDNFYALPGKYCTGGGGILLLNTRQQDSTDKIENRKSDEADERLSKKHLNS